MPHPYKTPGVYREEIFLKPEAKLPTGVPGFVGFAAAISTAELESLPLDLKFPDSLKDKADYDADRKLLRFVGVMSNEERELLLGLTDDEAFETAVNALFQMSQTAPVALHRKKEFTDKFITQPDSYLGDAITGFFDNGGTRCYVVGIAPKSDPEAALKNAVDGLAPLVDLDLVAIPDAMTLRLANKQPDIDAITRVQQHLLEHCARLGNRLAILDALPGDAVLAQRSSITIGQTEPVNGALYHPWIKIGDREDPVPPCGHIAGIFARTDTKTGVFKAPANEEVLGVLDLAINIDNQIQDQLNPEGVNCLRAFPGRGIRVWGARTLSRDPNWRYINIRRLFLTLGRWIDVNMPWAAFEPHTPQLWVRIQRELNAYLIQLWRSGALQGETSEQAFYVKCDGETNPPEIREAGQVVTEIGLAPSAPAEFVVVRIVHKT